MVMNGCGLPLEVQVCLITDQNKRNFVTSSNLVQEFVMDDLYHLKTAVVKEEECGVVGLSLEEMIKPLLRGDRVD